MECFKIEWKGFYTADEASNRPESRSNGVYAIYESSGKSPKLRYIGKAQELGKRVRQHDQEISRIGKKKFSYCIGVIYSLESDRASRDIDGKELTMVESFLINFMTPPGNSEVTKKGYKHGSVLVINTGKTGTFPKLMCHNTDLLALLKQNLPTKTKRTKRPKSILERL